MYVSRAALSALCTLALCQCTSGPEIKRTVTLEPSDSVRVIYRGASGSRALTLQSESIAVARDLYSSGAADPFAKVASDADLQGLLDAFSTYRFFEAARPYSPGNGRAELIVQINGSELAWVRQTGMEATVLDLEDFNRCLGYFSFVYNSTDSFHASLQVTGDDMKRQEESMQRRGQQMQDSQIIKTDRK
jgi:hypothetical protein